MNPYDCPQCKSSNTQSFENIHAQNVRQSYGIHGRYDSWNQLAAQTAPPQNPHVGCGFVFAVFLLTFLIVVLTATILSISLKFLEFDLNTRATIVFWTMVLVGTVTFIGGLVINFRRIQKQMPAYHQKLIEWNHSMLCRRCGYAWLRES